MERRCFSSHTGGYLKLKKLHEKSEIGFAILWIVIYTVCIGNLRRLGDDSPILMIALIVISGLLFMCVRVTGTTDYYGLAGWAKNSKAMLWFIPLWIIASVNLWIGISPDYPMPGLFFAAVMMAFVGFAEELIFRGFLFKAVLKGGNTKMAIIISSVTFGLGHILNLFIGQDLVETLVQIVFAVAVGFVLTMVFYKSGSLWPCILAHSLIDVTSVFSSGDVPVMEWIAHIIVFVLAAGYCLYLAGRVETSPQGLKL